MRGYYNPYQNSNPKEMWNNFYRNNKITVWLMGGALVLMAFMRASFFNIFFSVYLIYFGSVLFKQFFNDEKLLRTFIFAGLSGLALYLLIFNDIIFWMTAVNVFISAASISLIVAASTYAPDMEVLLAFFGRVKIKWLAVVLVALDILTINPSHPSPRIADIGGILYGFLSIYLPARRTFGVGFDPGKLFRKRGPYYKRQGKKKAETRTQTFESDEDYNARKNREQKEIDAILEKIKTSGYDSLTADEKRKLFDQSNR